VIFAATDQAARGAFVAAENSSVFAVASYSDQTSLAPEAILASVLYDYPSLVKMIVVNAAQDKLEVGKIYMVGVADGVGDLAFNAGLSTTTGSDVKAKVEALTNDIKAGRIKIPQLSKANESEGINLDSLRAK
jgi:basic membrane lipoprotein Med (substrate-binding protein (PBP1-ABC) superfamily)